MSKVVQVTQADRDAAADAVFAYRGQKNADWQGRIRRGEADNGEMVQSFARHREASQDELVEALAEAADFIQPFNRGGALLEKIDAALKRTRGEA